MSIQLKFVAFIGLLACAALVIGYLLASGHVPPLPSPGSAQGTGLEVTAYDAQGFVLVVLGLLLIGIFLIPRMAGKGGDSAFLYKLLIIGFGAKMLTAMVRMWMNFDVYGSRDLGRYNLTGKNIATYIRDWEWSFLSQYLDTGTNFTFLYVGVVYSIIGPTLYGGFLVFACFSFLGSYFYYRAFRTAFPESNYRLFGVLVFLLPSILYWPNGVGKDALMFLFIGLAAYGGALLVARWRLIGLVPLIPGLAGAWTIREPVAWMIVIGLVGAFLFGQGRSKGHLTKIYRGALLSAGFGVIWITLPAMTGEVGLDGVTFDTEAVDGFDEYLARRQRSTGRGGSGFESASLSDPAFIPIALTTALFRPFPWEAHNLQAAIQAMDGALLMGLMVWRAPYIFRALISFRSNPYVTFVAIYSFIMIIALMTIANFGTLVRERAMLLPFFLMLIAFQPEPKPSKVPESPVSTGAGREPDRIAA